MNYICKYTPIELIKAFGSNPVLINTESKNFEDAEIKTHANLCSHAKAVIENTKDTKELFLTNCCDSIRRVNDVCENNDNTEFLYFMDLPHCSDECAKIRFKDELLSFAQSYEKYNKTSFDKDKFITACKQSGTTLPKGKYVAVMGAKISKELLNTITDSLGLPVADLTCSGNRGSFVLPDNVEELDFEELMSWYAGELLTQIPCMRMTETNARRVLYENENLVGIIYNTVKFCDFYSFEYEMLKSNTKIPILKIESDFTPASSGQLSTRIEAFAENFTKKYEEKDNTKKMNMKKNSSNLYLGIDSGSTTTNMVAIDSNGKLVAHAITRTGPKAERGASEAFEMIRETLNLPESAFGSITATGYGRNNISFATDTRTEITCHAKGAHFINPQTRTIIDIGGQDSKVICLESDGSVSNFIMNDKCAAGTGRFLEMMASTLEVPLTELSKKGLKYKHDLTISSMCTVFAESEVISLIADNHSTDDIVHGLNKSVASRTVSMVKRSKGSGPFMMTGGVARNDGIIKELKDKLESDIYIYENPDLCGAIGAALFAAESAS